MQRSDVKVRRSNLEQNLIFPSCCKEDSTELLENLLVAKVYLWSVTGNRKLMSLLHLLGERGPNRAACEKLSGWGNLEHYPLARFKDLCSKPYSKERWIGHCCRVLNLFTYPGTGLYLLLQRLIYNWKYNTFCSSLKLLTSFSVKFQVLWVIQQV